MEITTLEDFNSSLTSLTTVINTTVAANVPCSNPSPFTKRWWTKEHSQACSTMRRTARLANNITNDPSHPSHQEYQLQCNTYTNLIRSTKKRHWRDWLEEADDTSIWTINHLISGPSTDGGCTRIPLLKTTTNISNTQPVTDNQHKSKLFFVTIFPSQGVHLYQETPERYPPHPVFNFEPISDKQILWIITKMSPFKATGPSGLSNATLNCTDLLTPYLG